MLQAIYLHRILSETKGADLSQIFDLPDDKVGYLPRIKKGHII
jgi:hypothetical protein